MVFPYFKQIKWNVSALSAVSGIGAPMCIETYSIFFYIQSSAFQNTVFYGWMSVFSSNYAWNSK